MLTSAPPPLAASTGANARETASRARAKARPSPRLAPVTRATDPSTFTARPPTAVSCMTRLTLAQRRTTPALTPQPHRRAAHRRGGLALDRELRADPVLQLPPA